MAQHDMNIANQGFAAFRADLNSALVAGATNNSGITEPTTVFANQWWYDTSTNLLKFRGALNTTWIEFATLDQAAFKVSLNDVGRVRVAGGTAATPALSFSTDNDTGFYGAADNTLRVSTAGNLRGLWNSTGLFIHGKAVDDTSVAGAIIRPGGQIQATTTDAPSTQLFRYGSDGAILTFNRGATTVGSVSVTTTATTYNTSSDYRLKDEVVGPVGFDAIAKLKALADAQRWYSWKADPSTIELGWYAHELAEVEPSAVVGDKDAVDEEGNPILQGRSDTRLIPVIVAALDKALAKIEELEARINVLEGN